MPLHVNVTWVLDLSQDFKGVKWGGGGCRWVLVLGKKVTKQTGLNGCVFTELMTLTDSKETKTQGARGQVETLQNEGIFCDNI